MKGSCVGVRLRVACTQPRPQLASSAEGQPSQAARDGKMGSHGGGQIHVLVGYCMKGWGRERMELGGVWTQGGRYKL